MVRITLPWVIATEVRTKNLLFKEMDSEHFKVRNLADNAYRGIYLYDLRPQGSIIFQSDTTIDTRNNAAGYVGLRSYDGSNYQTAINLKGGLAELARCKLTGTLDCNNQILSSGNFQGAHKLVGLSPDLWRNMGPYAYNNHFLPAGMLEYATAGSPTITWANDYLGFKLPTGGTASAQFIKRWQGLDGSGTWDKDRYIGARVWVDPHTDMGMWIATGNADTYYGTSCNKRHFGFVVSGSNLYPSCGNGTNQTLGTAVTISAQYLRLEAVLHAATDTIDYYKDGTFLQTLSTNVPNGTTDAGFAWRWNVWDYVGYNVNLYLYVVSVYQEA